MTTLTLARLERAVAEDAAIRRRQKLLPLGGAGDKIFPPTFPGARQTDPARHVFEKRRLASEADGTPQDVDCVLIDSVQSQANRLEEALLEAMREGRIALPHLAVDFTGRATRLALSAGGKETGVRFGEGETYDLTELGRITSLQAPHRVFDAIIRDSELDGVPFTRTELYRRLVKAKPHAAQAIFELSPTALLFGAWNSTGEGGGLGAKFPRCIVSEIVGVGAVLGEKTSSRIDPLGIRADARVVGGPADWTVAVGAKGEKPIRPSEINHSNIRPDVTPGGVTIEYALHIAVISLAGLRRLRFPGLAERKAQTVLAALGLVALAEQDARGYDLRSRCALTRDGDAPFELVAADGGVEPFTLGREAGTGLFAAAVAAAIAAGLPWNTASVELAPQQRLIDLVALSQAIALKGEREAGDGT